MLGVDRSSEVYFARVELLVEIDLAVVDSHADSFVAVPCTH
jgi:hypothetical protein